MQISTVKLCPAHLLKPGQACNAVGQDLEVEEKAAQQMAKWLRKVKGKGLMPVFFWGR